MSVIQSYCRKVVVEKIVIEYLQKNPAPEKSSELDLDDIEKICMEIEQEEAERSQRKRGFEKISTPVAVDNVMIPEKKSWLEKTVTIVIEHLNKFGACVIDDFLGKETGEDILREVVGLQQQEQLLHSGRTALSEEGGGSKYRGDRIVWTDGLRPHSPHLQALIRSTELKYFSLVEDESV